MSAVIRAEIITIGDEILFGHIVDTNTKWIGNELTSIGIRPVRKISVGDQKEDILDALQGAMDRADVIIVTGGLGPTKDDITKQVLCDFFETSLVMNQEALALVRSFFNKRGRELTDINAGQAELPASCIYLANHWGTAPGMWFEKNGKVLVSLPGVPFEMKNLMEHTVLPRLKGHFTTPVIVHKSLRTIGIGESFLAEKIADWESGLPDHIRLAYLPSFSGVRLRLTGTSLDEDVLNEELEAETEKVLALISPFVYGYGDEEIEQTIGQLLNDKNATLGVAESCTGGFLSHKITSVPGSSEYFMGSVVSYANAVKAKTLNVSTDTLNTYGAVSEQTAREMATSIRQVMGTTYGLATTGVAGPGGGSEEKPVGTVWIACSSARGTVTSLLKLSNFREVNIEQATMHALNLLRKEILK